MPDQLDQVSSAPPENIKIARMRIALQRLLDKQGERAESFAHLWTPLALQELS
jgi:hypothetical protein